MKTILSLWQKKTEALFLGGLFFAVFIFYPDLFWGKTGMLTGDHAIQHYPWAVLLSNSLKHFQLPFWTSSIHSGFPITAEGQIGSFYPPNWFFLGLLPTQWGYSYLHIFHFFLSGWGMYAYGRVIKLSPRAAFLTAFVYLFGTVYGGAYYNITSLKTLTWFPWLLFYFERFLENGQRKYIAAISGAGALAILAGYLQVAVYSLAMFSAYAILRLWVFYTKNQKFSKRIRDNFWIFFGLFLAVILSGVQLFLTYRLAMASTRAVSSEEFAYVGSLFPGALLTFFYPVLQGLFRGNCIYIGMLAPWLLLMGVFCHQTRQDVLFKTWIFFGLAALFLALGEWSPFYVGLIKLTHFYAFRTPAKFLFFICFSLAVLAGFGFQRLEKDVQNGRFSAAVRKASKVYLGLIAGVGLGLGLLNGVFRLARPWVQEMGDIFVSRMVYGKMGHPHTLEVYQQKWNESMDALLRLTTPANGWNLTIMTLMMTGALSAFYVLRAKKTRRSFLVWFAAIILIDLYAFSWNDLRKDFSTYASLQPPAIVSELLKEKNAGRVSRIYGLHQPADEHPLLPSAGALYGIDDIGAYSPLVTKRYLEVFGPLGNVDDSNGFQAPQSEDIEKNVGLLNFMNVSHILSTQPITLDGWTLVSEEKGPMDFFLYRNQNSHGRAYFISAYESFRDWDELKQKWRQQRPDLSRVIYFEKRELAKVSKDNLSKLSAQNALETGGRLMLARRNEADEDVWEVKANQAGFFVRSVLYESGWRAELNGQSVPVLAANGLFQAVWIPEAGTYQLSFRYAAFNHYLGE